MDLLVDFQTKCLGIFEYLSDILIFVGFIIKKKLQRDTFINKQLKNTIKF